MRVTRRNWYCVRRRNDQEDRGGGGYEWGLLGGIGIACCLICLIKLLARRSCDCVSRGSF